MIAIIAALGTGRSTSLLGIDADVILRGGECGLRSFVLALAALEPADVDVLSYEAPYRVGYLVATICPHTTMRTSTSPATRGSRA